MKPQVAHGTYAGWHQHKKRGTETCQPCKDAQADYMAEWRKKSGDPSGLAYRRAASRARTILVRRHHDEYEQILKAERMNELAATRHGGVA